MRINFTGKRWVFLPFHSKLNENWLRQGVECVFFGCELQSDFVELFNCWYLFSSFHCIIFFSTVFPAALLVVSYFNVSFFLDIIRASNRLTRCFKSKQTMKLCLISTCRKSDFSSGVWIKVMSHMTSFPLTLKSFSINLFSLNKLCVFKFSDQFL